ncbi:hypothetical protein [Halovenus halobia]|uniref:hypothetical protein n=1 Tax=Halovenus halobia TaxID=3396622 RepID=UPI003F5738C5
MRSRTLQVVILGLAVAGLLTAGVGGVAASHGEDVGDREIVEVQSVSNAPEQGIVAVELRYHIGDDVAEFETNIGGERYEVVGIDGFDRVDGAYEWDEQTSTPTVRLRVAINEQAGDAYDYVDAGEWAITDKPVRTGLGWRAYEPETIEIDKRTTVDGPGVVAGGMVYLGEYEDYEFSSESEQFRLVVSDAANPEWTVEEIQQRLVTASNQFDGGGRSQRLTLFVLTDPLRRGGLAISTNAAAWVHEAGLESPQTTLFHEYIHSRQDYKRTDATEWTIEGSADYFGKLLALKDGTIQYHRFHRLLERGNDYDDVILADRASWRGTFANYELGALTLATMDERLRNSGGRYVDVFRAKNAADNEISDSDFEALAAQAGNVDGFFDEYIRSTPPTISVPEPTVYDGPNTGAALDLQVSELDVQAGRTERVTATIANTGTEQSLAPQLSVASSDVVDVSLIDSDGSGVTETESGWVFDHLSAGEQYELTLTIDAESVDGEQVEFTAADLSNNRDAVSATLDSAEPLGATLSLPTEPTVGTAVNATVATTPEDADVKQYEFIISGPSGEQTLATATPTATFTPETAGTYTLSVAVTAADGRTTSAEGSLDVLENETTESGTGDDTADDTDNTSDDTDGTDDTGDNTGDRTSDGTSADDGPAETDATEDSPEDGSADGFGDGFGPAVVVSGLLGVALLARYRN